MASYSEKEIGEILRNLDKATMMMSEGELLQCHHSGILPTGIYNYLVVLRKAFPNKYNLSTKL